MLAAVASRKRARGVLQPEAGYAEVETTMSFMNLFSMAAMFLLMAISGFALEYRKDETSPEA